MGPTNPFGTITPPTGVAAFNRSAGGFGFFAFISAMIQVATVVAGIFVLFNIVLAGYIYITSAGDSSAHGKVREKITMSVIGIVLIVASYTITGVISIMLFGDPLFLLNPTFTGP